MALPNEVNNLMMCASADDGFSIDRSLRYKPADSVTLKRTWTATGNRTKFTWSMWFKRVTDGVSTTLIQAGGTDHIAYEAITIGAGNVIDFISGNGADVVNYRLITNQVLRDTAAWYHFVFVWDTPNATANDRMRMYINGDAITSFSTRTNPGLNATTGWMNVTGQGHSIGHFLTASSMMDGYMAEVHFVNGQALDPSYFGETDETTGVWKPKLVENMTYGTTGFYLSFANNSSTTTLGQDDAGGLAGAGAGSNDWTLTNFSVTAGVGNDSLTDTPTNNFALWNGLSTVSTAALTNGNMDAGASGIAIGNVGMSSGKWYWEITSTGGTSTCGMYNTAATTTTTVLTTVTKGFRFDADAGTFDWTTDGSAWTSITTGLTSGPYFFYVSTAAATVASLNSGQRPFAYAQPDGYSTICTDNLPVPVITRPVEQFEAKTYTGTGSSLANGLEFQPDMVWIKGRSGATSHAVYDAVRGVQKNIAFDSTVDEATSDAGLTAFGAGSFTVNTLAKVNTSTATYVAWCWKEGVTPGFDIVSYTGDGANRTIAHSLGTIPNLMIVKARTTASTDQPTNVYSSTLAATEYLVLDTTAAKATGATYWNSTAPTSSVFSLGTNVAVNALNDTYINYLFTSVPGFSKVGTFTGNASADGPFVYCDFRPRWVMIKCTSTTGSWYIWDGARDTINPADGELLGDTAAAEAATADLDFLSNGFKIRATTAGYNGSAATFLFVAFAATPFKYGLAV